jgi:hypothetical protein
MKYASEIIVGAQAKVRVPSSDSSCRYLANLGGPISTLAGDDENPTRGHCQSLHVQETSQQSDRRYRLLVVDRRNSLEWRIKE